MTSPTIRLRPAAAIVVNARTHGIPAAAENEEKKHEDENKRHEQESGIQRRNVCENGESRCDDFAVEESRLDALPRAAEASGWDHPQRMRVCAHG